MINLRYHIVSITAVFLALGIGLTLGSSFLDRVTVENLKDRLDTVQERVDKSEAESDALSERVDALVQRDAMLGDEMPARLLSGRLAGVSALVVATEGTDEALVDETMAALLAAGADVTGSWWLTERWLLDDADEVSDLGELLGLSITDPVRLRRNAAIRIVEVLTAASRAPQALEPDAPAETPGPATEPEIIAALKDAGFIDYRPVPGGAGGPVLLPGASARYVMVSGALPGSGPQRFATALVDGMVIDGPAPVVAAQGEVPPPSDAGDDTEATRRTAFVGPLREGELTKAGLSTVDHLDTAAGLAALVLAIEDLGELRTGHYGVGPGATSLLPGVAAKT